MPPQTIISVPVQTALWNARGLAAPSVGIAVHVSVAGSYRPPSYVSRFLSSNPPQTIISFPVQIEVCPRRAEGAPAGPEAVGVHVSVAGSYRPPELKFPA